MLGVPDGVRRDIADQAQHLLAQSWRQGHQRQDAEQRRRAQLAALALAADLAVLDVAADPLAQQHGQLPVPAREHGGKLRAVLPARPGYQQRADRPFQLAAGPRRQGVRLIQRDAERVGQVGAVEGVPQVALDRLAARPRSCTAPRCAPAVPSADVSVISPASSRLAIDERARSLRWHSLRATAYSHGLSRSRSRSPPSLAAAMTKVSWTASAASAGSASSERQYACRAAA